MIILDDSPIRGIATIEKMFYNMCMTDPIIKLHLMAEAVSYEVDDAPGCPLYEKKDHRKSASEMSIDELPEISYSTLPGGRKIPILKTLLSSACENNCNYCACRAGRSFRREVLSPEELADIFMVMYRKGYVQGIFLSSGIFRGAISTQDQLLKTAEILRYKYHYRNYIHLKIMPGAEHEQVFQAMKLADRVSTNLEGANPKRLYDLAPMKEFHSQLLNPLRWIEEIRQNKPASLAWDGRWPSTCTQFVVGGTDETDVELLQISELLYKRLNLARTYYSAFSPVPDTPLESRAPESMWRRYRLFQASFLLRDYPFQMEDMPFLQNGKLPLDRDPKLAWAEQNLAFKPIEINQADEVELLHVPGIGPIGANRILRLRRREPFKSLGDLKRIGVVAVRAAPYILLNGTRPSFQPSLLST
jgi:predicted DNA-binding helix-hairpin-helix protein